MPRRAPHTVESLRLSLGEREILPDPAAWRSYPLPSSLNECQVVAGTARVGSSLATIGYIDRARRRVRKMKKLAASALLQQKIVAADDTLAEVQATSEAVRAELAAAQRIHASLHDAFEEAKGLLYDQVIAYRRGGVGPDGWPISADQARQAALGIAGIVTKLGGAITPDTEVEAKVAVFEEAVASIRARLATRKVPALPEATS